MKRLKSGSAVSGILVLICIVCTSCHAALSENTSAVNSEDKFFLNTSVENQTTEEAFDAVSSTTDSTTLPVVRQPEWSLSELPGRDDVLLTAECNLFSGLRWVTTYNNIYSSHQPTATIRMRLPGSAGLRGYDIQFGDGGQNLNRICVYEAVTDASLDALTENAAASFWHYEKEEPITDQSNYLIQLFHNADSENESYVYFCFVRLSENYVLHFRVTGRTEDRTVIDAVLASAELVQVSEQWEPQQTIQTEEPFKPVALQSFYCVEKPASGPLDSVWQDDMPPETELRLLLPESWTLLPASEKDFENHKVHIYAELGVPKVGVNRQKCMYQSFLGLAFYPSAYSDELSKRPEAESGTTDSGNQYWLCRTGNPSYHAIEYDVYIQLSEAYIYNFYLCVDAENTELVYDIMGSLQLLAGEE